MEIVERMARIEERVSAVVLHVADVDERVDRLESERDREHGRAAAIAETAARAAINVSAWERRLLGLAAVLSPIAVMIFGGR